MPILPHQRALSVLAYVLFFGSLAPVRGQDASIPATRPDANLFTSYYASSGYEQINYFVCGSTQESEGCYSSGSLGPFGRAGALLEGNEYIQGDVVTRDIYIVDIARGTGGDEVKLYVYRKTDNITASYDTVTVKLIGAAVLPLVGGRTALCSMAANREFLFIGTDQSPQAVEVKKATLAASEIGGFSPPINVSSITADRYGYVTVTFGGFASGENGFYQFGPDGASVGDGGGAWFMLNTTLGLSTTTLPTSDTAPTTKLLVRPKSAPEQVEPN